jgi:hypothetical protein
MFQPSHLKFANELRSFLWNEQLVFTNEDIVALGQVRHIENE